MTQTAGLAVTYFDRFLSATGGSLAKNRVQIVALTCTLLAAKFSEIKMPSLDDLCEVAHGLFTKAQLKETELETLRVLQWELHAVTPHAALEQLALLPNATVVAFGGKAKDYMKMIGGAWLPASALSPPGCNFAAILVPKASIAARSGRSTITAA